MKVFIKRIIKGNMATYKIIGGEKGKGRTWQEFNGWNTPKAHQEMTDRVERFVKANNLIICGDNYTEE